MCVWNSVDKTATEPTYILESCVRGAIIKTRDAFIVGP